MGRKERGGGGLIVQGEAQGASVQLLVDTGASVNLLSWAWWKINGTPHHLRQTTEEIYAVTGRPMELKGEVEIPLTLGSRTVETVFIVADMGNQAIIGAPFLRLHKLVVDVAGERLHWTEGERACRIVSVRAAVIPAGEEALLEGCLEGDWDGEEEGPH